MAFLSPVLPPRPRLGGASALGVLEILIGIGLIVIGATFLYNALQKLGFLVGFPPILGILLFDAVSSLTLTALFLVAGFISLVVAYGLLLVRRYSRVASIISTLFNFIALIIYGFVAFLVLALLTIVGAIVLGLAAIAAIISLGAVIYLSIAAVRFFYESVLLPIPPPPIPAFAGPAPIPTTVIPIHPVVSVPPPRCQVCGRQLAPGAIQCPNCRTLYN